MFHGCSFAARAPAFRALGGSTLLAGLLACSSPRVESGAAPLADPAPPAPTAPAATASSPATASTATAASPATASAATTAPAATAPAGPASAEATAPGAEKKTAKASAVRGKCSGWDTLQTAAGEVRCYPYRCQVDRCLVSCARREDCSGSLGPGDFAAHGWPLDCAPAGTCFPLPPRHVHGGSGP